MRARAALLLLTGLPLLAGCAALDHGFLNAQGVVAARERHFFVVVSIILLFVWVPVVIITPLFAWHYRLSNTKDAYRPKWAFSWPIEGFIWLPPIGIVIGIAFLLWPATHRDDPYTRIAGEGPPVHVQAIALDWKWVFVYPNDGIATVNRLVVPAGRPVQVQLTSGTVMQSLLLPQLAGQIYAMAGMTTRLNFAADRPGSYLGENTQFNGEHFAGQRFQVIAVSAPRYAEWLEQARDANRVLDADAWGALSQKSTTAPATYSAVLPDLFGRVVAANGGRSHPHSGGGGAHQR